jgi:beta-galactosidase
MLNDFVRGWRRQNFWVMETQPGSVNWSPLNNALDPGETRALAWQTVGHGADAVLYWQWRSAPNGQEEYHGTIVGANGEPVPLYPELQQLGADFDRASAYLAGTAPHAEIALLHTYDSRWAIDFQPHSARYDQQAVLQRFYEPMEAMAQVRGQAVDIIDPTQPLSLAQYRLLVAPSLNVIDEVLAKKLLDWVSAGGTLLLGPRSGMKDEYNALNPERQPGPLVAPLGAKVAQFYALDHAVGLTGDAQGSADIWAEALTPGSPDVHVELRYSDPQGWLQGEPAMVSRAYGRGRIAYLGTLPDAETLRAILERQAKILAAPVYEIPADVELDTRAGAKGTVVIAINHGAGVRTLHLPRAMRNVLGEEHAAARSVTLGAQGVAVLVPEEAGR